MKRYDNRGRKIDYDAPGQIGRHSPKPEKLPKVDRFTQQLNALVEYHNTRGEPDRPLHVTLGQIRRLQKVDPEDTRWRPSGEETYRGHPLIVTEDP